jgi:hypothetical protein
VAHASYYRIPTYPILVRVIGLSVEISFATRRGEKKNPLFA